MRHLRTSGSAGMGFGMGSNIGMTISSKTGKLVMYEDEGKKDNQIFVITIETRHKCDLHNKY
jgi:hypothetical protein